MLSEILLCNHQSFKPLFCPGVSDSKLLHLLTFYDGHGISGDSSSISGEEVQIMVVASRPLW